MIRSIIVEFSKSRRKQIWLVVGAMIGFQLLWGLWSMSSMDERDLAQGWIFSLYQYPLLNSLMMPIIAAVVASRLCDMEHKGQTFRLLYTVMPAGRLFDAKFIVGATYLIAGIFVQVVMILMMGFFGRFTDSFPLSQFGIYFLFCVSVSLTILLLQQVLSLLWSNQLIGLTVGLLGSFAGLFSLYLPDGFQKFFLWSYYGVLLTVRMDWDKATRITNLYWQPANWPAFGLLLLMALIIYITGRYLFVKKEA